MSMLKATVLKRSVKWNSKTFRKLQKESLKGVLRKCCSGTFQNIHRKTSESESPYNTVTGCWPETLLKSDWCFPVRLAIFFKKSFFTEHLRPIYLKLLWSVAKLQTNRQQRYYNWIPPRIIKKLMRCKNVFGGMFLDI